MPIHAASFHLPAAYILFFPVPLYSILLLLVLFSSPAWACMAHMNSTTYWPVLLLLLNLHHLLSLDYNNSLILRPRFKLISLRVLAGCKLRYFQMEAINLLTALAVRSVHCCSCCRCFFFFDDWDWMSCIPCIVSSDSRSLSRCVAVIWNIINFVQMWIMYAANRRKWIISRCRGRNYIVRN